VGGDLPRATVAPEYRGAPGPSVWGVGGGGGGGPYPSAELVLASVDEQMTDVPGTDGPHWAEWSCRVNNV